MLTLSSGGAARHLEIQGGPGAALRLRGGATGEDLVLATSAPSAAAAILMPAGAGTLLRNAWRLHRLRRRRRGLPDVQNQNGGTASVVGVTAVATGRAPAVQSDLSDGQPPSSMSPPAASPPTSEQR